MLRRSPDKVVLHTAGSCRDVAAAFNREPDLLREKVRAVYIEIGNGPDGLQKEWNVTLDPLAFVRVLESGLPVYWCPCFGKDGYQTYYKADQAAVLAACEQRVQNYFVYCLTKSKEEPIAFLHAGPRPLPGGGRNMWCTAPLLHAAGRKIYERGPDDFVALPPAAAARAGLAGKAVDVLEFVPVRVSAAGEPAVPVLSAKLGDAGASCFIFRRVDPRYEKILGSCLKNLLSGLGK